MSNSHSSTRLEYEIESFEDRTPFSFHTWLTPFAFVRRERWNADINTERRRLFAFIEHGPHLPYLPSISRTAVKQPVDTSDVVHCGILITQQRVAARPNWSVNFKMSPRPFVITINTLLSFFFSHLCSLSLVFLFPSRTGPILRGQSSVGLRNAIIMPIIIGELLPFGSSEKFVATRDWILFNYTYMLTSHASSL